MDSYIENILSKNRIIGVPVREIVKEGVGQKEALKELAKERFFEGIEECERTGVLLGYDECIVYEIRGQEEAKRKEEEEKEIKQLLKSILGTEMHSCFLTYKEKKFYLYLKYTGSLSKLRIGPLITNESTEEIERFKKLWGEEVEHRRFQDGKIRICRSFLTQPEHAMSYILLSKAVQLRTTKGYYGSNELIRKGRLLSPVLQLEYNTKEYQKINNPSAQERLREILDGIASTFPVRILGVIFTGASNRQTQTLIETRTSVYIRLGRGQKWPTHDSDLFNCAITALNCVLGKALKEGGSVEGITKESSIYCQVYKEKFELLFDISEEVQLRPGKYALMHARQEYDGFFKEQSIKNPVLPMVCSLVKSLLYSHGLYPYHIHDKPIEILCYKACANIRTLPGAFKQVISTWYCRGYIIDIRRNKLKIRAKNTGKIELIHSGGSLDIPLPEEKVFEKMNQIFKHASSILEQSYGVDENLLVSDAFKGIFVPSLAGISFSLSRVPYKEYLEITHNTKENDGNTTSCASEQCFKTLTHLGCIPFFCKSGKVLVSVPDPKKLDLAIGIAILLTGMKSIRILS
ncbi:hypothetical protein NEOKW01_0030 [Nematocida sp. AWRm80]|nr:hypothetical protein NEOKW01_0030 [Nematocida sp. AWRm80]